MNWYFITWSCNGKFTNTEQDVQLPARRAIMK